MYGFSDMYGRHPHGNIGSFGALNEDDISWLSANFSSLQRRLPKGSSIPSVPRRPHPLERQGLPVADFSFGYSPDDEYGIYDSLSGAVVEDMFGALDEDDISWLSANFSSLQRRLPKGSGIPPVPRRPHPLERQGLPVADFSFGYSPDDEYGIYDSLGGAVVEDMFGALDKDDISWLSANFSSLQRRLPKGSSIPSVPRRPHPLERQGLPVADFNFGYDPYGMFE